MTVERLKLGIKKRFGIAMKVCVFLFTFGNSLSVFAVPLVLETENDSSALDLDSNSSSDSESGDSYDFSVESSESKKGSKSESTNVQNATSSSTNSKNLPYNSANNESTKSADASAKQKSDSQKEASVSAKYSESPQEEKSHGEKQYDNPTDSSSFYNAENWHAHMEEKKEMVVIRPELNLYAGYTPYYAFPIEGGIPYLMHMQTTAFWQLVGLFVRFDYLFAELPSGFHGLGAKISWNYLVDDEISEEDYVLTANHFNFSLFYVFKWNLPMDISVQIHAGGGAMLFMLPTYSYSSGFSPESYFFLYPQISAGTLVAKRFGDNFNINLGADFNFPLLLKVPYPTLQLSVGAGWSF